MSTPAGIAYDRRGAPLRVGQTVMLLDFMELDHHGAVQIGYDDRMRAQIGQRHVIAQIRHVMGITPGFEWRIKLKTKPVDGYVWLPRWFVVDDGLKSLITRYRGGHG